jgi:hypothetical protein
MTCYASRGPWAALTYQFSHSLFSPWGQLRARPGRGGTLVSPFLPAGKGNSEHKEECVALSFGSCIWKLCGSYSGNRGAAADLQKESAVPITVLTQKFSIIHTLLSVVKPTIARWRPSGEGTPQVRKLPFCSHTTLG